MQQNKECILDHVRSKKALKTTSYNVEIAKDMKQKSWYNSTSATTTTHYLTLFIFGCLTWGLLWLSFGDEWQWDGAWFRLVGVGVVAWISGQILQAFTTLPPLLAALLTGIFARSFHILDMRHFTHLDAFLRKIYPVLILGKGSLAWDVNYMKQNWRRVASLGLLPWSAEVVALTICTKLFLGFPWLWGVLLGSIYASVSCPVIMPSVQRLGVRGAYNWPQLVCTAGGTDTALSVGVYGLLYSYMFSDADQIYRYVKAALALLAGVALGVTWGWLAGRVPHSRDYYVTEMRVLFVLLGGLFGNFFTGHIGWGATGGVAVLACNATAATYWARDGWKLNSNAASTAYRVLWAAAEPFLFAYTGTFFVMSATTGKTLLYGLAILLICLAVRLTVAALVCWDMSLKEKIFVCCAWTPKSIVEAVLCPVAVNTLLMTDNSKSEMGYAEDIIRLIVQAILITTPIGFLLTHYLGPILLKQKSEAESDSVAQVEASHSTPASRSRSEDVHL